MQTTITIPDFILNEMKAIDADNRRAKHNFTFQLIEKGDYIVAFQSKNEQGKNINGERFLTGKVNTSNG